jgi:UDP-N-acetylmuramyl pentapeptide synthase
MIDLNDLLEITQGELRSSGIYKQFTAFSHDTRQLEPEEMFVAVRGGRGDGHDYVLDAIHKGATGLLVEAGTLNVLSEKAQAELATSETSENHLDDVPDRGPTLLVDKRTISALALLLQSCYSSRQRIRMAMIRNMREVEWHTESGVLAANAVTSQLT